jgi:hypothetical protein
MKWKTFKPGTENSWVHSVYEFHDLYDADGMELGFVRVDLETGKAVAYLDDKSASFDSLKEAKEWCLSELVKERLDNAR